MCGMNESRREEILFMQICRLELLILMRRRWQNWAELLSLSDESVDLKFGLPPVRCPKKESLSDESVDLKNFIISRSRKRWVALWWERGFKVMRGTWKQCWKSHRKFYSPSFFLREVSFSGNGCSHHPAQCGKRNHKSPDTRSIPEGETA